MLPYIYSVSWQVTNGSVMMRPLGFDFPEDPQALDVGDQFLFGPSVLVAPATKEHATSRSVYLPTLAHGEWTDFWTGKNEGNGKRIDAAAPLETMPLFVRPGSILPMGPLIQYTSEKPADPMELRIYPGADGQFTLYED